MLGFFLIKAMSSLIVMLLTSTPLSLIILLLVEIISCPDAFEYYDESIDELSVMPGRYQILYGSSSRDKDLKAIDFQVI